MNKIIILGIDPGFHITGYSVISKQNNRSIILDFGFLKFKAKDHLSVRTAQFYTFFYEKIEKYSVNHVALETPFLGKNVQTFLKLGYLRGILYLLADQKKLLISEFSPRQVKQSVTGYGGATKDQVANMVLRMVPNLNKFGKIEKQDVTDALAVSICGLQQSKIG